MAFKDLLRFLVHQSGLTQDEFAARHKTSREHMNRMLTGNYVPPVETMTEIVEREGVRFDDCVDVPPQPEIRSRFRAQFRNLEVIVSSGDEDRIHGITVNLLDIAAGAIQTHARENRRKRLLPSKRPHRGS